MDDAASSLTQDEFDVTGRVYRLLDVPQERRDEVWREGFLADLPRALFVFEPGFRGPDGFPYRVFRRIPEGATEFAGGSIRRHAPEIMDALEGVAVEPRENGADWVLSFGDLACDRMFGRFSPPLGWTTSRPDAPVTETLQEAEEAMIGSPNIEYLPEHVRFGVGHYLRAFGVVRPRALLVMRGNGDRSLVFNLLPRDVPDEREREAVLQRIFWYLPKGYLVLGTEDLARSADIEGVDLLPPAPLAPPRVV